MRTEVARRRAASTEAVLWQVEPLFKIGKNDCGPPELLLESWLSTPSDDARSPALVGVLSAGKNQSAFTVVGHRLDQCTVFRLGLSPIHAVHNILCTAWMGNVSDPIKQWSNLWPTTVLCWFSTKIITATYHQQIPWPLFHPLWA